VKPLGGCEEICVQSPQTAVAQARRREQMSVNPGDPLAEQTMLIQEPENFILFG
jgi:hypothetical protein